MRLIGAFIGVLSILLCAPAFRHSLISYPHPEQISDVLPQLETLYQRFSQDIFPYAPVPMVGYSPYPVYMPLHWLPVSISMVLQLDVRWTGFILLLVASAIYGFTVFNANRKMSSGLAITFPAIVLITYLKWGGIDLPVSLETVVATYYLVLAAALLNGNIFFLATGIGLCLLSRYTLVFWLPLFAWLYFKSESLKKNVSLWAIVATAVVLIYVFPFYLRDTTILKQGIKYHQRAVVDEWHGYGNPPVSYSFETGIYFAPFFKKIFNGSMEQRVFYTRVIQGALMLLLNVMGIWFCEKRKLRLHPFIYSLLMLYTMIACFYFFSPLTYRYYLITVLMLSGVIAGSFLCERNIYSRRAN